MGKETKQNKNLFIMLIRESNLKLHHSKEITKHLISPMLISGVKGKVFCEKPRFELEKFNGRIEIDNVNDKELENISNLSATNLSTDTDQLSSKNILLRGAILRNTKWVKKKNLNLFKFF